MSHDETFASLSFEDLISETPQPQSDSSSLPTPEGIDVQRSYGPEHRASAPTVDSKPGFAPMISLTAMLEFCPRLSPTTGHQCGVMDYARTTIQASFSL